MGTNCGQCRTTQCRNSMFLYGREDRLCPREPQPAGRRRGWGAQRGAHARAGQSRERLMPCGAENHVGLEIRDKVHTYQMTTLPSYLTHPARLPQPIVHPPASSASPPAPVRSLPVSPPMTIFHGRGLAASSSGRISALSGMWPRCWDVTKPTRRSRNVCRWVTVRLETWLRSAKRQVEIPIGQ